MYKAVKFVDYLANLIFLIVFMVISEISFAASFQSTQIPSSLEGHAPFFKSIGARIQSLKTAQNNPLTVGSILEVPTYLPASLNHPLYQFDDADGDPSGMLGIGLTESMEKGQKPIPIKWYIIKAKPGFRFADEPDTSGSLITHWSDDQIEEIEPLTGFYSSINPNSHQIIIPQKAAGYRIGFKALPTSEYGVPDTGRWLKAWDLNYFYTQSEVREPGYVQPENCAIDADCGVPTTHNPDGAGGVVSLPDYFIKIFDQDDERLLSDNVELAVNHTYFAIIQVKDAGKLREPNEQEISTLKWHIMQFDSDDSNNPTESILATYAQDSGRFINHSQNESTELILNGERYKKYFFSTQTTNSDAHEALKSIKPNFSEQSFGLQVSIEFELSQ